MNKKAIIIIDNIKDNFNVSEDGLCRSVDIEANNKGNMLFKMGK